MRSVFKILTILFTFVLSIVLMLSCIRYVSFNKNIFHRIQTRQEIGRQLFLSQEDLDVITSQVIDYIRGEKDDFVVTIEKNDLSIEVFNDYEKAHMVDVLELYNLSLSVIIAGVLVIILFSIVLIGIDIKEKAKIFIKTAALTITGILAVVVAAIAYALIDFYNFWIFLHELVFTNDLYFLDPSTDLLVNIMTLDFFVQICLITALCFGLCLAVFFAIVLSIKKLYKAVNHG